jgi:hypothetical protein
MPTRLRSLLFASLIGFVALPAMADVSGRADASGTDLAKTYSWDKSDVQQAAVVWLPDERTGPMQTMAQIAPALLMIVLAGLGLTITFTSLRKDMKHRRRVVYRPRGPPGPAA